MVFFYVEYLVQKLAVKNYKFFNSENDVCLYYKISWTNIVSRIDIPEDSFLFDQSINKN